jgi:hypothetical protein
LCGAGEGGDGVPILVGFSSVAWRKTDGLSLHAIAGGVSPLSLCWC